MRNGKQLFNWFISLEDLLECEKSLKIGPVNARYITDDDFELFVFHNLTQEDAISIAFKLLSESPDGFCTKSRLIVQYMNKDKEDFWVKNPGNCLSYVRRVHCICHEVGSFHKHKRNKKS